MPDDLRSNQPTDREDKPLWIGVQAGPPEEELGAAPLWRDPDAAAEFDAWRSGPARQETYEGLLLVATLYLDDASVREVTAVAQALSSVDATTILEPGGDGLSIPHAVFRVAPSDAHGPRTDGSRPLADIMMTLAALIGEHPAMGSSAVLGAGRFVARHVEGPVITAAQEAREPAAAQLWLESQVVGALDPAVLARMEALLGEEASLLLASPPGSSQPPSPPWLIVGARTPLHPLAMSVLCLLRASSPFFRDQARADGGAGITAGDRLQLQFRCPDQLYIYGLLQVGRGLSVLRRGEPLRCPGGPFEGIEEIAVGEISGLTRPMLLGSTAPLGSLTRLAERLNRDPGAPAEVRLRALMDGLEGCERREGRDGPVIALMQARTFELNAAGNAADDPDVAEAQRAERVGRFEEAVQRLQGAVDAFPPGSRRLQTQVLLGRILRRQRRSHEARELLQAVEQDALAWDLLSIAGDACRELGRIKLDHRQLDAAWPLLDRAVAMHQRAGDAVGEAWDTLQRAVGLWLAGSPLEAARAYRQVLEPARRAGSHALLASALQGLGQIDLDLGHLESAEDNLRTALAELIQGAEHSREMSLHGDLGLLALHRGRPDEALRHLDQQIALARQYGQDAHVALALANKADVLERSRRPAEALALITEARDRSAGLHRVQRAGTELVHGRIAFALGNLTAAEEALGSLETASSDMPLDLRWQSALARGRLADARGCPDAEVEYRMGIEAIEEVRSALPHGLRQSFLDSSLPLWRGWIGHLVRREAPGEEVLAAVDRFRARGFLDAMLQAQPGMGPVPEGAMSPPLHPELDRVSLDQWLPRGVSVLATQLLEEELLLIWADRQGVRYTLSPCPRATVEAHAAELLNLLANPRRGRDPSRIAEKLGAAILAPMAEELANAPQDGTLLMLQDGALHGLPVHALSPEAGSAPVVSRLAVTYAPSLAAAERWLKLRPPQGGGIVALGDPLGDLPFAQAEAVGVARLLGGDVKLGRDATVGGLLEGARTAHILHLAAHAKRRRYDTPAHLQLAPDPAAYHPDEGWQLTLRSGMLGASSIARIRTDAALVVLAACDSGGGGALPAGDGPDLVSWAFLAAGARSVVASGWPVPDEDTSALIRLFYQGLIRGEPRGLALARAQRRLMKEERPDGSPADSLSRWAAFHIIGDWRPLYERSS